MAHQIKKNLGVITHRGGAEFRVWAPFAKQVYIDGTFTPNGKQPLTSEDDGYWFALIHGAEPGHVLRSEERRVGKECRSRWSPYH